MALERVKRLRPSPSCTTFSAKPLVGSKAVSQCTKLERYPLEAHLWRPVGQKSAEPYLESFCVLRVTRSSASIKRAVLRMVLQAGTKTAGSPLGARCEAALCCDGLSMEARREKALDDVR